MTRGCSRVRGVGAGVILAICTFYKIALRGTRTAIVALDLGPRSSCFSFGGSWAFPSFYFVHFLALLSRVDSDLAHSSLPPHSIFVCFITDSSTDTRPLRNDTLAKPLYPSIHLSCSILTLSLFYIYPSPHLDLRHSTTLSRQQ